MRYFYLTVLILCLSAVQESSFSGVKPTAHPKRHGDITNEHDHGARKPRSEMRHFQNEKGKHVRVEKLKEERHIKDDNLKQRRHVKDEIPKDTRHVKAENLRERKYNDGNAKQGRHVKDQKSQEARHIKNENLKEPRHTKDKILKEGRQTKDGNVKQGRHVKNEKLKEAKDIKDEKLIEPKHAKDEKLRERRHKDDNIKEGRHIQNEKTKEARHVKDKKSKETRHIKTYKKKEGTHIKDDKVNEGKHVKDGRHVKDDKSRNFTSQNNTRKHPKEMRHFQNQKGVNLINQKPKVLTLEKNAETFQVTTTSIGPAVHVNKLRAKILHKFKGQTTTEGVGKHFHGNRTSHKRKDKKSRSLKLKDDKSKPGFRAQDFSSSYYISSSSTEEMWPEEWDDHWMEKKQEALNFTQGKGDTINMAGARPWTFPCGDPGQLDLPWGTCMLAPECDAEYRIYRGDSFCGRTSLVCCALQMSNYDFYHGMDISFGGTSYSTDSEEDHNNIVGSKELKRRIQKKANAKRRQERAKRKQRMEKSIKYIVQEVKTILHKAFKNGTTERREKINRIREYINNMKKKYRKDRQNLVKLHHKELVVTDEKFQLKLNQVRGLNQAFMTNDTFRDIIVNGTVNTEKLMLLLRKQPQLIEYFNTRRSGGGEPHPGTAEEVSDEYEHGHERKAMDTKPKSQEYDVEYGVLYY